MSKKIIRINRPPCLSTGSNNSHQQAAHLGSVWSPLLHAFAFVPRRAQVAWEVNDASLRETMFCRSFQLCCAQQRLGILANITMFFGGLISKFWKKHQQISKHFTLPGPLTTSLITPPASGLRSYDGLPNLQLSGQGQGGGSRETWW